MADVLGVGSEGRMGMGRRREEGTHGIALVDHDLPLVDAGADGGAGVGLVLAPPLCDGLAWISTSRGVGAERTPH